MKRRREAKGKEGEKGKKGGERGRKEEWKEGGKEEGKQTGERLHYRASVASLPLVLHSEGLGMGGGFTVSSGGDGVIQRED